MTKFNGLMAGIALAALAAACTTTGLGVPGFGDSASGCRTIYVYRGGGIQPVSNCSGGGGGVPRELRAKSVQPQALASLQEDAPVLQDANAPQPVTPVSLAAKATAPVEPPKDGYPGANEMLENADMSAFMTRVRTDFSKKENAGAWGYMIIDAIAADDPVTAQAVVTAMAERQPPEMLSANHLRPWVFAAAGRSAEAMTEMQKARRILPAATLLGHRALLAEGTGDTAAALAIYGETPDALNPPKPEDVAQPDYLARAMAFNSQRLLMLRQAELLRAVNRNPEAVDLLTKLLAASPEDAYVRTRLERARANTDARPARTLKQAMALAISDEADIVEERQTLMGMMVGRGGKLPFNHLLSSLRQGALLLDPDNGDIRLGEVGALYTAGKFEPALRIAQIGNPPKAQAAALWSTAGLAALELGSPDTLVAMTDRALAIDSSPEAKIQAAGALTSGGKTDKALQLIDQALKTGLNPDQQVFAQMSKGQANLQAGNVAGAVEAARAARRLRDDDGSKQFLASMLVEQSGAARTEGIELMHAMLAEAPDNTGLMNNLGYCLVDDYASDGELEEGFKLLKRAIRITPDEPNLLDSIGWAYYQYGDFREAKRYIGLALDAYEPFDHWELSDHFGDVSWRLGEQEEARKAWKHSLDSYPPVHNRAAIEAKLKDGLKTPAPTRRDTPEVPLSRDRNGVSDI